MIGKDFPAQLLGWGQVVPMGLKSPLPPVSPSLAGGSGNFFTNGIRMAVKKISEPSPTPDDPHESIAFPLQGCAFRSDPREEAPVSAALRLQAADQQVIPSQIPVRQQGCNLLPHRW
jgi:hypothetical protein